MRTGKWIGGGMDTTRQRRGWLLASPCSRSVLALCEFVDVDNSRLRSVCGQSVAVAAASSRTIEAAAFPRTRTVCERDCGRGLNADTDCSRTRTDCARGLFSTESRSRICRVCGHEPLTLRGYSACSLRPIRGRRSLAPARGKACPVLNMMRNTLPPLLQQLVAPVLQLRGNGLNAGGLFNRPYFDASGVVSAKW